MPWDRRISLPTFLSQGVEDRPGLDQDKRLATRAVRVNQNRNARGWVYFEVIGFVLSPCAKFSTCIVHRAPRSLKFEELSRFRGREGWVVTASWMPPPDAANEIMEAALASGISEISCKSCWPTVK